MLTQSAQPRLRRWTRKEYYRMADLGLFDEQRVELIEGEVIEMPPQNNPHVIGIKLVERALESAFGDDFWVRVQAPLNMLSTSAPEPDIAVVAGNPRDFKNHPASALLIVEISDTTLLFDQSRKASLYAKAGIADYWILNLIDRQLEVHRSPVTARGVSRFGETRILTQEDSIAPLALPRKKIKIADLLP